MNENQTRLIVKKNFKYDLRELLRYVVHIVCLCILVCSQVMCTSQITVTFHLAHVVITSLPLYKSTTVVIVCSTRVFMRSTHHSLWPLRDNRVHDYRYIPYPCSPCEDVAREDSVYITPVRDLYTTCILNHVIYLEKRYKTIWQYILSTIDVCEFLGRCQLGVSKSVAKEKSC